MRMTDLRGFGFVLWDTKNSFCSNLLLNQSEIKYSSRFVFFPQILQVGFSFVRVLKKEVSV